MPVVFGIYTERSSLNYFTYSISCIKRSDIASKYVQAKTHTYCNHHSPRKQITQTYRELYIHCLPKYRHDNVFTRNSESYSKYPLLPVATLTIMKR